MAGRRAVPVAVPAADGPRGVRRAVAERAGEGEAFGGEHLLAPRLEQRPVEGVRVRIDHQPAVDGNGDQRLLQHASGAAGERLASPRALRAALVADEDHVADLRDQLKAREREVAELHVTMNRLLLALPAPAPATTTDSHGAVRLRSPRAGDGHVESDAEDHHEPAEREERGGPARYPGTRRLRRARRRR